MSLLSTTLAITIFITSTLDGSLQPSLVYMPEAGNKIPVIVSLHSWGGTYQEYWAIHPYLEWCQENNYGFIVPNFRGPNDNPSATGSDLAIQDIVDVVNYVKQNNNIGNVYIIGGSGGGYAGLLAYAQHPELFSGASIWVPITDIGAWYYQTRGTEYNYFADNLVASTGGIPGESSAIDEEYFKRSPLSYLTNTLPITIDLNVGIFDGHTGSVPVSHSLLAFNALANDSDKLNQDDIDFISANATIPDDLSPVQFYDVYYQILFRRESRGVRLSIFDGGHQIVASAALNWIKNQENRYRIFIPLIISE